MPAHAFRLTFVPSLRSTNSLHSMFTCVFFANSHTPLNTRKERGEKWSTDSCFGWFSMETFVQLANAGLPTRPVLQL